MCMGSSPSPPPPAPPPPAPPPVLEQVAPKTADGVGTQASQDSKAASGTKKYRTSIPVTDAGASTSGLGIPT